MFHVFMFHASSLRHVFMFHSSSPPVARARARPYTPPPMIEKIFKAYDVRATYPNPLNEEAAWKVGHATGQYLQRSRQNVPPNQRVKMESTVCVGRDMRPHSPALAKALCDGLRSTGLSIVDVGM